MKSEDKKASYGLERERERERALISHRGGRGRTIGLGRVREKPIEDLSFLPASSSIFSPLSFKRNQGRAKECWEGGGKKRTKFSYKIGYSLMLQPYSIK